ncbi:hypothetical protein B0H10DRAFT_1920963 [Mycena sp. CBHHK59/15]|nr:hypothetical protein B0H10DRAFT_1920963 [Mycena sp. CBHHK59/15]
MIIDKSLPDAESIHDDAPPAYDASSSAVPDVSSSELKLSTPAPAPALNRSSLIIAARSLPAASSWLTFTSPTARQVRATVLGLVRDLVRLQPSGHSEVAISILKSCSDACTANNLSISTILQERSVEGHTPLYWAIVKRPAEAPDESSPNLDLLTTLLCLSTPLTPATTSDVRLACLLMSDQVLFQRLRNSPEFAPLNPTDEMLLDVTVPPDDIVVENLGADSGAFAVDFAIVRFQKRMLVSNAVVLEFIARGRMWRLSFNVSTQDRMGHPRHGTWYTALALLEQSLPTWIDSRLLVHASEEPLPDTKQPRELCGGGKTRPRPVLSVRIRANEQLRGKRGGYGNEIIVPLDGAKGEGGMGCLQYAGCPYIAADETLHGRLEARLVKPETECVIC